MKNEVGLEKLAKRRDEVVAAVNQLNNNVTQLERQLAETRNQLAMNIGALSVLNEFLPQQTQQEENPTPTVGESVKKSKEEMEEVVEVEEVVL